MVQVEHLKGRISEIIKAADEAYRSDKPPLVLKAEIELNNLVRVELGHLLGAEILDRLKIKIRPNSWWDEVIQGAGRELFINETNETERFIRENYK